MTIECPDDVLARTSWIGLLPSRIGIEVALGEMVHGDQGLEDFARHPVEARPQGEAEVLAATQSDHVAVPETDAVEPRPAGRVRARRVPSRPASATARLGGFFGTGVPRGLEDDRVPHQKDAPGLVVIAVLPAVPLRHLDGGAAAGG